MFKNEKLQHMMKNSVTLSREQLDALILEQANLLREGIIEEQPEDQTVEIDGETFTVVPYDAAGYQDAAFAVYDEHSNLIGQFKNVRDFKELQFRIEQHLERLRNKKHLSPQEQEVIRRRKLNESSTPIDIPTTEWTNAQTVLTEHVQQKLSAL